MLVFFSFGLMFGISALLAKPISDINGKNVDYQQVNIKDKQTNLSLSLSKGIYFIQLTNPISNENYTQKLFIY